MDKLINEIIDEAVKKDKHDRPPHTYYPSSLHYCMRKQYYEIKDPQEFPAEKLRIFEMGNILHDWIAKVLKESDRVEFLGEERSFVIPFIGSEVRISGRLDDFIRVWKKDPTNLIVPKKAEAVIVEVKSIKSLGYVEKEPKEEHVSQLQLYLKAFGTLRGAILYIEKTTLKTKTHEITYDPKLAEGLMKRALDLDTQYVTPGILPPKEEGWLCRFCDHKEACMKGENPKSEDEVKK